MGNFLNKPQTDTDTDTPLTVEEMISQYSYDLDTEVMLIFDEEEEDQQNQLIVFPHIEDTNLNAISDAYKKLQKDQEALKKNKQIADKEVAHLTTRIKNTKDQINQVFEEDLVKNKENLTKFGDINERFTNLKDKFSSLLSDYSIKKQTPDNSKVEEEKKVEVEQKVEQKVEQNPNINTVISPVININATEKQESSNDNMKDIATIMKMGGGNIKFKDDPFDYIFEKFSKRELNKIGNDWNLSKTNKYNKNELINILKLMLKYKNNIKITKKELKLLATSIQVKRNNKGYNKNEIKKKLINVRIL